MSGFYTKLDSGITDSTIWQAPDTTRIVWITMLAMVDHNGYVGASMPGLAGRARVKLEDCIAAIALLEAPDEWSRTKENEGRRIAPADGGWVLLNYEKYRAMQSADDRRERSRIAMQKLRAARKAATEANGYPALTKLTHQEQDKEQEKSIPTTDVVVGARPTADHPPHMALVERQKGLPDCPHAAILALWADVCQSLPQHDPKQWKGARADHLRARWRETAEDKGWTTQEQGLVYFAKFFAFVKQSPFLTGRANATGKRPFFAELEWLVLPGNWAKTIEGKYHPAKESA